MEIYESLLLFSIVISMVGTTKKSTDEQNTSSSSYKIKSRNTFNKTKSTNIRLLSRNEVNNIVIRNKKIVINFFDNK